MEMGLGGAGNSALGFAAVSRSDQHAKAPRCPLLLIAVSAVLGALPGCTIISTTTGVVTAIATGTATGNPAVGVSLGIAAKAGVDEAGRYVSRQSQEHEQDAIASLAAGMRVGDTRSWETKHSLTSGGGHGEIRVTRLIRTPIAVCKELMFSVVHGAAEKESRAWYTTQACQNGHSWKWAAAEPAVERWGNLQ